MRSYSVIMLVVAAASSVCRCAGVGSSSDVATFASANPSGGRLTQARRGLQRTSRDTDGDRYGNEVHRSRTVNTYRHVTDGTSSSADPAEGWIIGGSRRRASASGSPSKHYQDKTAAVDRPDKQQWPAAVGGPDAASSLSEVQIVVQPPPTSPYRDEQHNNLQQQTSSDVLLDTSSTPSKWYSKRLSYATKSITTATASSSLQPVVAENNAVLLTEVLGQKSGFINTTADKGYYGPPATGSKGFQNDLMDMLGKSMWPARFRGTF